jgi:hypothetical protein
MVERESKCRERSLKAIRLTLTRVIAQLPSSQYRAVNAPTKRSGRRKIMAQY